MFAVSSVCFGKLGTSVILLLHTRCLPLRQTTTSQFVSMSFVTLLDYSVVDVRVEGHQSAVMMCNNKRTVLTQHHAPVIPGFTTY